MPKSTTYESKTPDQNGIYNYDAEETGVWRELYHRQM